MEGHYRGENTGNACTDSVVVGRPWKDTTEVRTRVMHAQIVLL